MLHYTLECIPTGKARPRFARRGSFVQTYDSDRQKAAVAELEAALLAQGLPQEPLSGPLSVIMTAYMPIPASWPKKRRQAALGGAEMPTSKPDADNLAKQLLDVCNGKLWHDDAQVVQLSTAKVYSDRPRWELLVMPAPRMLSVQAQIQAIMQAALLDADADAEVEA